MQQVGKGNSSAQGCFWKPTIAADQLPVTLIFCRANLENITYFVKGKTQYFVLFL